MLTTKTPLKTKCHTHTHTHTHTYTHIYRTYVHVGMNMYGEFKQSDVYSVHARERSTRKPFSLVDNESATLERSVFKTPLQVLTGCRTANLALVSKSLL